MKSQVYSSNLSAFTGAVLAGLFLVQAQSASAGLAFGRGTPTSVGSVQFSSSPDSVTITGALTAPGAITTGLSIPAGRIQYDLINGDQGSMSSWTVNYSSALGPSIIGAFTPLGYVNSSGAIISEGGVAYTTLFNAGYGVYTYNTGAPWSIDYEADHVTFTAAAGSVGLPATAGAGYVEPTPYLPSFALLFNPSLPNGLVPASATVANVNWNGQVFGPILARECIFIQCSNLVVETCSNCAPVSFSATATDACCSNVSLKYDPPSGTCFPPYSSNLVEVVAQDACGNSATNYFTVTVIPGNCPPTNCLSIYCSNIVAFTCSNCTTVPFTATAEDPCCASGVTLVYNPPATTCFPIDSTNVVQVVAHDGCGQSATNFFLVTVLPGPNCGGSTPHISMNPNGAPANFITLSWPEANGQLQESSDLVHWWPIPGATNSPFVVSNPPPKSFFRLQYH